MYETKLIEDGMLVKRLSIQRQIHLCWLVV